MSKTSRILDVKYMYIAPDAKKPDQHELAVKKPDQHEPAVKKPDQNEPDVKKPLENYKFEIVKEFSPAGVSNDPAEPPLELPRQSVNVPKEFQDAREELQNGVYRLTGPHANGSYTIERRVV